VRGLQRRLLLARCLPHGVFLMTRPAGPRETISPKIESAIQLIERGGNDERVRPEDVRDILQDLFALVNLTKRRRGPRARASEMKFDNNAVFWKNSPGLFEGVGVMLENFSVSEWAPTSPGRYFTQKAEEAREEAANYVDRTRDEYTRLGKMHMIFGGFGSVRLAPVSDAEGRTYFLGASSNGISHQGIPLALDREIYGEVIPLLRERGAVNATIVGRIELLPEAIDSFEYALGVRRYVVRVEDIDLSARQVRSASVSLSVLFLGAAREYEKSSKAPQDIGWTFACFNPCKGDPEKGVARTVSWMKDYAFRHSVLENPPIVCDFDQHTRHFEEGIIFKIDDLVKGTIDMDLLRRITKKFRLEINIEQIGDRFENITNSTIINRSTVLAD
jgi:hypothetical protein